MMSHNKAMHVAKIPNRNSAPTYLLRETYREGGKVKHRILGNITSLGSEKIRNQFGLNHVTIVGDCGMLTGVQIQQSQKYHGLRHHLTLRSESLRHLLELGIFNRSFLDENHLSEVTADDYHKERFIVCHNNPLLEKRVRAHFFICMLSYYVVWHLRRVWAAYLFSDENLDETRANRNPVVTATPNKKTTAKKARNAKIKITSNENDTEIESGEHRVESFQTILSHLATICRNDCRMTKENKITFNTFTIPNSFQVTLLNQIKTITIPNKPQE
ncbi:MAG: hypothetical protein LBE12_06045 [Planctomycetaceae bacterium]|jgi:hypothetical protein|nr:hypothetical protein [Planctomycetaceae bacterium]